MARPSQITIRNVSPDLARRLKALAEKNGTSVNAVVLKLLEKAIGVDERRRRLQQRFATWTDRDFQEFDRALRAQRTIDAETWE